MNLAALEHNSALYDKHQKLVEEMIELLKRHDLK